MHSCSLLIVKIFCFVSNFYVDNLTQKFSRAKQLNLKQLEQINTKSKAQFLHDLPFDIILEKSKETCLSSSVSLGILAVNIVDLINIHKLV